MRFNVLQNGLRLKPVSCNMSYFDMVGSRKQVIYVEINGSLSRNVSISILIVELAVHLIWFVFPIVYCVRSILAVVIISVDIFTGI